MKAIIVTTDAGWEGCYVDGKLIAQDEHLGEGKGFLYFLQDICQKYNLDIFDWEARIVPDHMLPDNWDYLPENLNDIKWK